MSRFRRLLMSVAVSVMITDLVLVAFACAPETTPSGTRNSIVVELATEPSLLFAGGGGDQRLVKPAFLGLGSVWKWAKNCWAGYAGGSGDCKKKCKRLQSRPCNTDE